MTVYDLIEYCKAQSLADKLSPAEDSEYQYICRSYSKTFHTPLHVVETLAPEKVILAYFQDFYDDVDAEEHLEKLLDMIYEMEDPTYSKEKRDELRDFMKQAEREEEERVKSGKPIHPGLRYESEVSTKNTPKEEDAAEEVKPTGGFFNANALNLDEEQ